MKNWLNDLLHAKVKLFIGGCAPGLVTAIVFLYNGPSPGSTIGIMVMFGLKVFVTFILAFTTGAATVLGGDLIKTFKRRQKLKRIKKIKNDQQKRA